MAAFPDKFNEIKTLIDGAYYAQAKDECDNGAIALCSQANALLSNTRSSVAELAYFEPEKIAESVANILSGIDTFQYEFLG